MENLMIKEQIKTIWHFYVLKIKMIILFILIGMWYRNYGSNWKLEWHFSYSIIVIYNFVSWAIWQYIESVTKLFITSIPLVNMLDSLLRK